MTRRWLAAAAAALAFAAWSPADAHPHESDFADSAPDTVVTDSVSVDPERREDRLRPGAWEMSGGGTFTNSSGSTYAVVELHVGRFVESGRGLFGMETNFGYTRTGGSSIGGALLALSWQRPMYLEGLTREHGVLWPYFGVTGGVSQEWNSLYDDTRFPVGGFVGVRMMSGWKSAIRIEGRVLRYLDVVYGDYTQSGFFVGYSVILNNPH